MSLLEVRDLTVSFPAGAAVEGLGFTLDAGESLGLVGESGSGKTQTALALMGLAPGTARVSGSVRLDGTEIVAAPEKTLRDLRARRVAMIFQDPLAALNPYRRIGDQLEGVLARHRLLRGAARRRRVLALLERTGLPDAERQAASYPHQLSGGMRQRVMIAAALIAEPDLVIADEPTTALDATLQAQILALLEDLRRETGVSLLLITHDLGVIAQASDRMLVLHEGRAIEAGETAAVFAAPQHARTQRLLDDARGARRLAPDMRCEERSPLLELAGLSVAYPVRGGLFSTRQLTALRPLDLRLRPGETVGIVGESGSGKSSLARAVLGLVAPRSGTVSYVGRPLAALVKNRRSGDRRQLQMVFQDPTASLDPAMRIAGIVGEPLRVHKPELDAAGRHAEAAAALTRVGLDEELLNRYPHQLSGGQAQRVAIARALVIRPSVLICDEAVASLDASVRQDILRLLADEQRRSALAIVFISHDLAVVKQLSRRVLVLYLGHVFEAGSSEAVFDRPRHPYTRGLLDSIAEPDPERAAARLPVAGEIPSPLEPPTGCVFHPRCRFAVDRCASERPRLDGKAHAVACWRSDELDLSAPAALVAAERA